MAVYKGVAYAEILSATGNRFVAARLGAADADPATREDSTVFERDATATALRVHLSQSTTGLTPPSEPNSLVVELRHADTATVAASVTVAGTATSADLFLTSDDTATGAPLIGDYRLFLRVVRTDVGAYDVNSDTQNYRGFVRANPTSMTVQMWHSGAANPASYADNIEVNIDLSHSPGVERPHRHFDVRALNATTGVQYAIQRTEGTDPQNTLMKVNNRFPATQVSVNIDVEVVAVPSVIAPDSEPAAAWMVIPLTTADRVDAKRVRKGPLPVDATIWLNHHLQVNSNVYDPLLDQNSRITADLGFVTTRVTNARSENLGGITYRSVLRDRDNLVAPAVNRTVTTEAATGRPPTMAPWDSQLPGGIWFHEGTITAPTDAIGLEYSLSESRTLLAANPALGLITGAGPSGAGNDVRHLEPGMTVLIGLTVMNVFSKRQVAVDPGSAAAAVCRFNLTFGRAEFLDADGIWKPTSTTIETYYWPLSPSSGDPNTHIRTFDSTGWGVADLFVIGVAKVGGVPLSNYMKEVVVSGVNNHDHYKFDGAGWLLGLPTR